MLKLRKYKKTYFLVVILLIIVIVSYTNILYDDYDYSDVSCHFAEIEGELPDTTEDTAFNPSATGRSIFFHETSCKSLQGRVSLSPRQACAIESAARHHPNHTIYVLYSTPVVLQRNRDLTTLNEVLKYENVVLGRANLKKYVKDTPLEEWFETGALNRSYYRTSHTSDVLRYLTLWKYGGVYLDLDVVVLRSLTAAGKNFAGMESRWHIAAGVLALDTDVVGRLYANEAIRELRDSFDGAVWGNNGPGVITRVLRRHCPARHPRPGDCDGFMVFPQHAFYPIKYTDWEQYFSIENLEQVLEEHRTSYTMHAWNKWSVFRRTPDSPLVPYTHFASIHCPRIYSLSKNHF